ncbi:MAG: hypothetical protein ACHQIM_09600 [Sphingobacteriales bacterium]
MKRTALLLLTAIYLLSCLGIAADSYYCCGVLQSTSVAESPKTGCKMNVPMKNCCKTKKQYFKVKDQHFTSPVFSLNINLFQKFIHSNYSLALTWPCLTLSHAAFNSHGPPDWPNTPAYIQYCTYRI